MSSYTEKMKKLLKQGHEQNVADINTAYEESLKNLMRNVSGQVAAHGMNYSSLPGSMTAEGQSMLEAEKTRNLNLEGMNYQKLLLDLLKPRGGGGGSPAYQPGANPYLASQPVGTDFSQLTTDQIKIGVASGTIDPFELPDDIQKTLQIGKYLRKSTGTTRSALTGTASAGTSGKISGYSGGGGGSW